MQKSLGFFRVMAAIAIATVMVFGEIASGTAENLTWVISNDGTLTISGTGDMPDYTPYPDGDGSSAPWSSYRGLITKLEIIGAVTSIGMCAFSNFEELTSVEIPNSVTSIGKWAFSYCSGLTSVSIPSSVASMDGAFADCIGLTAINVEANNSNYTSVDGVLFDKDKTRLIQYPSAKTGAYTIPNSVTDFGDAFVNCVRLTAINIPNSVASIKAYAFSGCGALTSVIIPSPVTSIGAFAFSGCSSLAQITNRATTPQELGSYVFSGTNPSSVKLYAPDQSLAAYKSDVFWKDFDIQPISTMPTAIGNAATKQTFAISFAGIKNGEINLNLKAGNYTAELYNLQGRLVSNVNINALNGLNATGIKTNNLSKGMFILNVKQAGASVLKQKVRI